MSPIYIALGANLSNPKKNFVSAISDIATSGIEVIKTSSLWHSPAWPKGQGHPDYVNAVISVSSDLGPIALLKRLHIIEAQYGRERTQLNAPRPLDLDIVDYKGQVKEERIVLPHPRMMGRPFVLLPLLEIAPDWRHPITQAPVLEALSWLQYDDVMAHHIIQREWLDLERLD